MSGMEFTIDSAAVQRAFNVGPKAAMKEIGQAVRTSINRVARDARRNAPKAFSTLTNSIIGTMVDPLTGEVAPGVDYARMVEEGTDPGGMPPLQSMEDWIRVKGISPNDGSLDPRDLAYVMARSIASKGTPAQPYLAPALDKNRAAIAKRVDQAVDKVLRQMERA